MESHTRNLHLEILLNEKSLDVFKKQFLLHGSKNVMKKIEDSALYCSNESQEGQCNVEGKCILQRSSFGFLRSNEQSENTDIFMENYT